MQRYTYMRLFNDEAVYSKLFTREFNSELLLLLMQTFREQVINNPSFNKRAEQLFIVTLLWRVSKTPDFDFCLSFLDDDELESFKRLINSEIDKVDDSKHPKFKELMKTVNSANV